MKQPYQHRQVCEHQDWPCDHNYQEFSTLREARAFGNKKVRAGVEFIDIEYNKAKASPWRVYYPAPATKGQP